MRKSCLPQLLAVVLWPLSAASVPRMVTAQAVPPHAAPPPPPVAPTEADRQKAFEADADRLAKLADQLKLSLEHTRRDELSVTVVRTADEMERLARSARTRIH